MTVSKGQRYSSEARETTDPDSGRRIRQVTNHPSIHHHPFFFVRAYDDAMTKMIFVSHRTGTPQSFAARSIKNVKCPRRCESLSFRFAEIRVAGYTDAQGGAKGASALSTNRAKSVVKFLSQYIKVSAVAAGYGNTNFVANNTTEAGRAANRRAEGFV